MSLSYDGSLLYHLAAHMPLPCIIIVAPPSCPFIALACRCLLRCLYCWHLFCTSLFWLIIVFTPLSCLLPLPSPRRRIRHQRQRQRLETSGIRTSEQQKRGQCHHADGRTARQERAAESATRARVDEWSTQREQTLEQKLLRGECGRHQGRCRCCHRRHLDCCCCLRCLCHHHRCHRCRHFFRCLL